MGPSPGGWHPPGPRPPDAPSEWELDQTREVPAAKMLRLFQPMFGKRQRLILVWRRDSLPKVVPGSTFSLHVNKDLWNPGSWLSKGQQNTQTTDVFFCKQENSCQSSFPGRTSLMGYLVGMPTLFPLPPFPVWPLPSSFSKISFQTPHHRKASFKFKHCPGGGGALEGKMIADTY